MGTDQISQILVYILGVMIFVLFILVIVFINIRMKAKRSERNYGKEKNDEQDGNKNKNSKMESYGNVIDFMEFEKVEDNMIVQKDTKRYIMVIECKGVNYDLMSGVEKTGVEQGFLQFLNTLKHPIQLYIQTRSINLEKSIEVYKQKLSKVELEYNRRKIQYNEIVKAENMTDKQKQKALFELTKVTNLYEYGKDIIRDTEKMSLNKNVLNKKYYIVIAYNNDDLGGNAEYQPDEIRDIAFSDLYTKSQSIIRALTSCGVIGKVLNSLELAELLYMAYNRESAETFGIERALKAGYDQLYATAPDVMDKRIRELDKEIEKEALIKARKVAVEAKTEKQLEMEKKEREMDKLIDDMAKIILDGNKGYLGEEITEKAKQKITQKGGMNNAREEEKNTTVRTVRNPE